MVKFTLYHAKWCGHCKNFIATWNQLRNDSSLNNVEFEEFEETVDKEVMKKNNIRGYPTLVINNENHEGRRDYDTLRSKLKNLLKNSENEINKLKNSLKKAENEKEKENEKVDIVKEKLEETDNDNAELMFGGGKRKKKSTKRKANRKPVSSKNKKRKKTKERKSKRKSKKKDKKIRKPTRNKKVKRKRRSKK